MLVERDERFGVGGWTKQKCDSDFEFVRFEGCQLLRKLESFSR
jgi:hypothetical protein